MYLGETKLDPRDFIAEVSDQQMRDSGVTTFDEARLIRNAPHHRVALFVRYGDFFFDPSRFTGHSLQIAPGTSFPHYKVWIEVLDATSGNDLGTVLTCD
jgi:hypothetical protein